MRRKGRGGGDVGKVKKGKRRWWRTDGRGSEVDGGQPAAGGLRESGHHAGQGPVLSLQPLLNLPQGLNLLYLGEVLQGPGGGGERGHTQKNKTRGGDAVGGLMKDGRTEIKRKEGPTGGREGEEREGC